MRVVVLRFYYRQLGGHVHCRVFSGPRPNQALGKNGDLVFTEAEWPTVKACLEGDPIMHQRLERLELVVEMIEEGS